MQLWWHISSDILISRKVAALKLRQKALADTASDFPKLSTLGY